MAKKRLQKSISKEQIAKAASVPIMEYVASEGVAQYTDSARYVRLSINGHDSFVVDKEKNVFVHNGNSTEKLAKGNIISFLRYTEDLSFADAVKKLLAFSEGKEFSKEEYIDERIFRYDIKKGKSNRQAYGFLAKRRHISPSIINQLFNKGYAIQDDKFHLVLNWTSDGMPPKTDKSNIVGATNFVLGKVKEGQINKWIMAASQSDGGFNIRIGKEVHDIYIFESAMDLLSYWSLHQDKVKNAWLVDLEGLKERTLYSFMNKAVEHQNALGKDNKIRVHFGVDNDNAGYHFLDNLTLKPTKDSRFIYIENVPHSKALTQKEAEYLKKQSENYKIPLEFLTATYLVERPYLKHLRKLEDEHKLGALSESEKSIFYFSNMKDLTRLSERYRELNGDIYNNRIWNVNSNNDLYSVFEEREMRLASHLSEPNTVIVTEVVKDWNDMVTPPKIISQEVRERKEDSPRVTSSVEEFKSFLQQNTKRLTVNDIQEVSKDSGISSDIISLFASKGWIRREENTKEIYIAWSRSGEIIGGEKLKSMTEKSEPVRLSNNSYQTDSFIYTVGKPKEIKVFSSTQESLAYMNLHRNQRDYVAITDNGYPGYLEAKIKAYALTKGIQKVIDCRTDDKKTELNHSVRVTKEVALVETYKPIERTWQEDVRQYNKAKDIKTERLISRFKESSRKESIERSK